MPILASRTIFSGRNRVGAYAITAGNAAATPVIIFDRIEGTGASDPRKSAVVLDITSRQMDEATNTFLEARITTAPTEVVVANYEDGDNTPFSQASATALSDIYILVYPPAGLDTNARVLFFRGVVSGDTGMVTTSTGGIAETPLQITSISNPIPITIPILALSNAGVTSDEEIILAAASFGEIVYLPLV